MPGETGSSLDGEINGAITAQSNASQSTRIRSEPVNIVCTHCGRVPSQPSVQYDRIVADGESTNIFGNYYNYCQHHAPQLEPNTEQLRRYTTEPSSSSRAIEQSPAKADRLAKARTLPSINERVTQAASQGTPAVVGNGQGAGAALGAGASGRPESIASTGDDSIEPASTSLVGLRTISENTADHWDEVCSYNAEFAKLTVQDALISDEKIRSNDGYPFTPLAREWGPCVVSIESHRQDGFRRLKVEGDDVSVLWIPNTRVKVFVNKTAVRMHFSNCNKLQPPGHYRTQNGTPLSVTTYHPDKPNVTFEVEFAAEDTANTFRGHVLHNETMDGIDDDAFAQRSPDGTVMHYVHGGPFDKRRPCVLVWMQDTESESKATFESHEIVALSDKFDLDITAAGQEVKISIGYVDQLTYYPAFDEPDLPQNVKRTLDGAPARSAMEGGHLATSNICLNTTSTDAQTLINGILSKTLSWSLEAIFLQLDVKISSSKRFKFGSDNYTAQVTLWSMPSDHSLRILIRASSISTSDEKSESTEPEWFAVTLFQGHNRPTAELKQKVLTIKKVDCEDGHCLSTKDLRPLINDAADAGSSSTSNSNSIDLELRFDSTDKLQRFRETVTDRFLQLTES